MRENKKAGAGKQPAKEKKSLEHRAKAGELSS